MRVFKGLNKRGHFTARFNDATSALRLQPSYVKGALLLRVLGDG
jgi:hypothetical protein